MKTHEHRTTTTNDRRGKHRYSFTDRDNNSKGKFGQEWLADEGSSLILHFIRLIAKHLCSLRTIWSSSDLPVQVTLSVAPYFWASDKT